MSADFLITLKFLQLIIKSDTLIGRVHSHGQPTGCFMNNATFPAELSMLLSSVLIYNIQMHTLARTGQGICKKICRKTNL